MAASDARKKSLFDDSDDESDGGVKLQINSEYAKRFEHNKKREELQRRKLRLPILYFVLLINLTKQLSGGEVQVQTSQWEQIER